jgi:hypothetical protein
MTRRVYDFVRALENAIDAHEQGYPMDGEGGYWIALMVETAVGDHAIPCNDLNAAYMRGDRDAVLRELKRHLAAERQRANREDGPVDDASQDAELE